nr:hypothetical protein [uncultured Rhodopila sp.]
MTFIEQKVVSAEEAALRRGDSGRAAEQDRVECGLQLRFDRFCCNDFVDQPDTLGFAGIEPIIEQHATPRGPQPDGTKHVRRDRCRCHSDPNVRNAELRVRSGEGDVGAADDANAAAETGAVHEGDSGLQKSFRSCIARVVTIDAA